MSGTDIPFTVITLQQFRDSMPKFSDPDKYPDGSVQMWLNVANNSLNPQRWGQFWSVGIMMYAAHNIYLDETAANGVGGGIGIMTSKSIGPASVGYDVTSTVEERAGQWNSTMYGRRYISMARLVGAGGTQISPYTPDPSLPGSGPAWPGILPHL